MAKKPTKYLNIDAWNISELGYHKERHQVSESLFSLANEVIGIRGYFEEGVSEPHLLGTYLNGMYALGEDDCGLPYKGIVNQTHFMLNAPNVLDVTIKINGAHLDLSYTPIKDFTRTLDFKTGVMTRSFTVLDDASNDLVTVTFKRIVSMVDVYELSQQITFTPHQKDVHIHMTSGIDGSILHNQKENFWDLEQTFIDDSHAMLKVRTKTTKQPLRVDTFINTPSKQTYKDDKRIGHIIDMTINEPYSFEKMIYLSLSKRSDDILTGDVDEVTRKNESFNQMVSKQITYYDEMWGRYDIHIEGDDENQQGIRYCIFQLNQTYHGVSPEHNIGAKGLTGEAYNGHAFWDTETYCLPFFMFHDLKAAKNLILYRYKGLEAAKKRARDLDCLGACYPIATLNGDEASTLWQHSNLQIQPTTAVAYAIYHYMLHSNDKAFLYKEGVEMLYEISLFLMTRGQWNRHQTKFGYYGVMGPDEFQMMVNHNAYTNYMGLRSLQYIIDVFETFKKEDPEAYQTFVTKHQMRASYIHDMKRIINHMYVPYDETSKVYEQHDGFFDLPHIDVDAIPVEEFPLYHNWSYDRIYRNNMIKQPDVLMFMFLYNQAFDLDTLQANYDYYEPLTIHESSLSPSIHSILSAQLGRMDEAYKFFGFATRLDLDDYNRNTREGLHTTSIAAAWMNIVYGFGGFRSDKKVISLAPSIPDAWESYTFHITIQEATLKVKVTKKKVTLETDKRVTLSLFGEHVTFDDVLERDML